MQSPSRNDRELCDPEMSLPSRQERHRARQEREHLAALSRKAERMEAHERRMKKQAEDAARARADRARRHQERTIEGARRRREKDPRYTRSNGTHSNYSQYEYLYGAYYQTWTQPDPSARANPIHEALNRYKDGLERMNQLVAIPGAQLCFTDIPWPTMYPIDGVYGISKDSIKHIVLSEMLYPGKDRRGRLIAFLLQWHPDKFVARWIPYVRESDRTAVEEGVTIVAGIVNDLLSGST
ncbi:hypothetical protein OPQ81_011656 [Rhizoctonia solani]|nr:hypothetical protein OPQ81_011656 [Rhizoctonia solani]